ncbi:MULTISPECIES: TetR/AcrR family transcriptional regulator [unclassified Streptomyces]|uniref:TetR/AcrR family transcriptional regulator n=1 Tax=unclassified Streptomyces TaxID=2593676 RepID=UPI00081DB3AE|nr:MULTISPECIES: TetR/AcrR family transcriptional regulator [unclassified Streptomyces]MYR94085.1 TetR family transcriptional regulator [Streptomyces sp. SID4937]SCD64939.1 transcriptional regulator, TetR family [Streptomyces sp. ScaeMP-e83]
MHAESETAPAPMGRRERKKAATRQAIADAALRLFLERGYDEVSLREIADAADVSTTTLFKHFSGKEALVFDRQDEMRIHLLDAVRERPEGRTIPAALCEHALRYRLRGPHDEPGGAAFVALVNSTPALVAYQQAAWMDYTADLAAAIAEESGLDADDPACTALAHFALETPHAFRGHPDGAEAVRRAFELLENGWQGTAEA